MKTTTDNLQSALLKKFHTKCTKAGISADEKYIMIGAFGHDSSRDMSVQDLIKACDLLDAKLNPQLAEMDKLRKQVIASIGGWRRLLSQTNDIDKIKGTACRASGFSEFNKIPKTELIAVYHTFLKMQKTFKGAEGTVKTELETLTYLN